jgi:hypothetical protein
MRTGITVHLNPTDRKRLPYAIDAFSIDPTSGSLTPVSGEPFVIPNGGCPLCGGGGVYDLKTDVSGTYLFAPVWADGTIGVYRIDQSSGSLSAVADSPFSLGEPDSPTDAGAEPISITVDAGNLYVFVDTVTTNGAETPIATASFFSGSILRLATSSAGELSSFLRACANRTAFVPTRRTLSLCNRRVERLPAGRYGHTWTGCDSRAFDSPRERRPRILAGFSTFSQE